MAEPHVVSGLVFKRSELAGLIERTTKLELEAMKTEVEADFAATEQHLKDHKLPLKSYQRSTCSELNVIRLLFSGS